MRVVVKDILESIAGKLTNADESGGEDLPCLGSRLGSEAALGDFLELVVGLVDDLIDLALVVLADLLKVLKGLVDICGCARDEPGVAGDGLLEPLHGLARLRSVLCGFLEY